MELEPEVLWAEAADRFSLSLASAEGALLGTQVSEKQRMRDAARQQRRQAATSVALARAHRDIYGDGKVITGPAAEFDPRVKMYEARVVEILAQHVGGMADDYGARPSIPVMSRQKVLRAKAYLARAATLLREAETDRASIRRGEAGPKGADRLRPDVTDEMGYWALAAARFAVSGVVLGHDTRDAERHTLEAGWRAERKRSRWREDVRGTTPTAAVSASADLRGRTGHVLKSLVGALDGRSAVTWRRSSFVRTRGPGRLHGGRAEERAALAPAALDERGRAIPFGPQGR